MKEISAQGPVNVRDSPTAKEKDNFKKKTKSSFSTHRHKRISKPAVSHKSARKRLVLLSDLRQHSRNMFLRPAMFATRCDKHV